MKRPMCVVGGALAMGTWISFFFSSRDALLLSAAALVTGLLVAAMHRGRWQIICTALLTVSVALALHARYEQHYLEPFADRQGQVVEANALVTDVRRGARTIYYTLDATFPNHPELPATPVHLRAYGEMEYLPGDVLLCNIRLAPKEQPKQGLRHAADSYLEGFLEGGAQRIQEGFTVRRGLIALRERLRSNVYNALHPASADIVSAMVLGLRDNLSSEAYSAVNRAGTAHLLAISGLHLSVIAAISQRVFGGLQLSRRIRSLLPIVSIVLFALMVGFSASIVRSLVMTVTALCVSGGGRRRGDALSALGFAAVVICLIWPDWILGRSFWLSTGATLGIVVFSTPLGELLYNRLQGRGRLYNRLVRAMTSVFSVSLSASVFTLPLMIVFTGWVSLVAPLSNLLVAPFVPVVLFGGMLCAALGPAGPLLRLVAAATDFCTAAVLQISRAMGALPFGTAAADQAWMLLWFGLVLVTLLVLVVFRADRRLLGYAASLLVLAFSTGNLLDRATSNSQIELAVIEGCDAAVLLCEGDAVILGTPEYYEINQLLRYLEYRGVRSVRAVLATDHGEQVGSGLPRLAERYRVDCIVGPNDAYILGQLALALPDIPVYSGGYAQLDMLGGARIEVITPGGDLVIHTADNAILKSQSAYAILEDRHFATIAIHPDGALVLNGARGRDPNPIGAMLFGEQRWVNTALDETGNRITLH